MKVEDKISISEGYASMIAFLEKYYDTTKSDELGGILGGLALSDDGSTMDPACWGEWLDAVQSVIAARAEDLKET